MTTWCVLDVQFTPGGDGIAPVPEAAPARREAILDEVVRETLACPARDVGMVTYGDVQKR